MPAAASTDAQFSLPDTAAVFRPVLRSRRTSAMVGRYDSTPWRAKLIEKGAIASPAPIR